jgi:hypothetical protein
MMQCTAAGQGYSQSTRADAMSALIEPSAHALAATMQGVSWLWSRALTLTSSRARSHLTTAAWSCWHAKCSMVRPVSLSGAFGSMARCSRLPLMADSTRVMAPSAAAL